MSRGEDAKLTVGELRKELEGLPDDMQVCIEVETEFGGFFELDTPNAIDVRPLDHSGRQCLVIEFEDAGES